LKIYNVLQNVREIVDKPKPDVYVTDLTGDGVNIAIYFWIDTEKNKPIEVFDIIATEIKNALSIGKNRALSSNMVTGQSHKQNTETDVK